MKKVKIFFVCFFVLFLLTALGGCGLFGDSGDGGGDKSPVIYTVSFETNGGSEITPVEIEKGETINLSSLITTNGERAFLGFYSNSNLSGDPLTDFEVNSNRTLYAKWSSLIYFETNSGSAVAAIPAANGTILDISEIETYYEGMYFFGFYTSSTFSGSAVKTYPVNGDATLYAKWVDAETTYTVTFTDRAGAVLKKETVKIGQNATPPKAPYGELGENFSHWVSRYEDVISDSTVWPSYTWADALTIDQATRVTEYDNHGYWYQIATEDKKKPVDIEFLSATGDLVMELYYIVSDKTQTVFENGAFVQKRIITINNLVDYEYDDIDYILIRSRNTGETVTARTIARSIPLCDTLIFGQTSETVRIDTNGTWYQFDVTDAADVYVLFERISGSVEISYYNENLRACSQTMTAGKYYIHIYAGKTYASGTLKVANLADSQIIELDQAVSGTYDSMGGWYKLVIDQEKQIALTFKEAVRLSIYSAGKLSSAINYADINKSMALTVEPGIYYLNAKSYMSNTPVEGGIKICDLARVSELMFNSAAEKTAQDFDTVWYRFDVADKLLFNIALSNAKGRFKVYIYKTEDFGSVLYTTANTDKILDSGSYYLMIRDYYSSTNNSDGSVTINPYPQLPLWQTTLIEDCNYEGTSYQFVLNEATPCAFNFVKTNLVAKIYAVEDLTAAIAEVKAYDYEKSILLGAGTYVIIFASSTQGYTASGSVSMIDLSKCQEIILGELIQGEYSRPATWYRLVVSERGPVTITLDGAFVVYYYGADLTVSTEFGYNSGKVTRIFQAGTYYLKVISISSSAVVEGSILIAAIDLMSLDVINMGGATESRLYDFNGEWYKIEIEEDGMLNITLTEESGDLYIYLFKSTNMGGYVIAATSSVSRTLESGTYYLWLKCSSSSSTATGFVSVSIA